MESTRHTWSDERMDEFAERTEQNFRDVRSEIRAAETSLRAEMNERFARLEEKIDRRTEMTLGAMATGFITLIIAQFLG